MLLVIVFSAIFFTLLVALSSFVLAQNRAQNDTRSKSEAFNIAEAGLDHYRWYLSHFPGDITDGTGHAGPYVHTFHDPEGGTAGNYSLSILGNSACGVIQSIDTTSIGTASDTPSISTTLWARYARPSVARYNMILNTSVWFGGGPIYGPLHSNGGIKMDGDPDAPVTSSISSWTCDYSFGCSPSRTVTGIFGSGTNQNMWKFPTPQTDFAAIASSFTSLKTTAQSSGLYFARTSTASKPYLGYHLIFNANNTVTVRKVTTITTLSSYPADGSASSFVSDYTLINNESNVGTYAIPANCGVIFVEDNAWIEGTITQKVTVIAANVVNPGVNPNIVVPNNLVYSAFDGSVGLTAIASHNLLIGPNAPTNLTMDGIFVAQSGAFGVNLYTTSPYSQKGNLNMLGTVVTMLRPVTYWMYWSTWAGYPGGTSVFDRQNSTNPPPFTPTTSTQWQFVDWQQK